MPQQTMVRDQIIKNIHILRPVKKQISLTADTEPTHLKHFSRTITENIRERKKVEVHKSAAADIPSTRNGSSTMFYAT